MCLWNLGKDYTRSKKLPLCASSIFIGVRAGEAAESNKYFKSLPERNIELSTTCMVLIIAPSKHFRIFRRLILAASLWGGELQLDPFQRLELKNTGGFLKSKRKSVVVLGIERVVKIKTKVWSTVVTVAFKTVFAFWFTWWSSQFLFLKWWFYSFPSANWW